jgi:hypothetical protein
MFFREKKLATLSKLAELYMIQSKYIQNPDSIKANLLFTDICKDIMKDGDVEFVKIIADKYSEEISKEFADNSVH